MQPEVGRIIYSEDDNLDYIYFIIDGAVEISKNAGSKIIKEKITNELLMKNESK